MSCQHHADPYPECSHLCLLDSRHLLKWSCHQPPCFCPHPQLNFPIAALPPASFAQVSKAASSLGGGVHTEAWEVARSAQLPFWAYHPHLSLCLSSSHTSPLPGAHIHNTLPPQGLCTCCSPVPGVCFHQIHAQLIPSSKSLFYLAHTRYLMNIHWLKTSQLNCWSQIFTAFPEEGLHVLTCC